MAGLNKIRGNTQVQPGTVPALVMDSQFAASVGDLFVDKENHSGDTTGVIVDFPLQFIPVPGSEMVFLRGTLRIDGYQMTGPNLQVLHFDVAPESGDDLIVSYRKLIV
jgi:hypothetical protein